MQIIKKIPWMFSFLFSTLMCQAQVEDGEYVARRVRPVPKDSLSKTIEPNTLHVWAEADSIETFLLEGWYHDTTDKGIQGFLVKKVGPILKGKQKKQFIGMLTNPNNYLWDGHAKHCSFVPNLAFRAKKASVNVHILMCLNCDVWQWHQSDHSNVILEADPAHDSIRLFAASIFPNTNYLALRLPKTMSAIQPVEEAVITPSLGDSTATQFLPRGAAKSVRNSAPTHFMARGTEHPHRKMHTVKRGDTLFSLSKQYKVSIETLKKWNHLKTYHIQENSKIIVGK
jgi:hypothetical protein